MYIYVATLEGAAPTVFMYSLWVLWITVQTFQLQCC